MATRWIIDGFSAAPRRIVVALVSCTSLMVLGAPDLEEAARARCAAKLEVEPTELENVIESSATLPTTKISFSYFKFAQPLGAHWCEIALTATAEVVDAASLIANEEAAQRARYGALSIEQDAAVRALSPTKFVNGLFILARPVTPNFRTTSSPLSAKREFLASFSSPVLSRLRSSFPSAQFERLDDFFGVRFSMQAADLLATAQWSDFVGVEFENTTTVLLQSAPAPNWYNAAQFSGAHSVSVGAGGRIGVVESGQLALPFAPQLSPYLSIAKDSNGVAKNGDSAVGRYHAEAVFSVISSRDVQQPFSATLSSPGGAPETMIDFAGNSAVAGRSFGSSIEAVRALLPLNEDALSFSFFSGVRPPGSSTYLHTRRPEAFGLYLDELAYDFGLTFVAGAGNINSPPLVDDEYVASPASALNVLAVGGIDTKRTDTWTDDVVSASSSYVNPVGLFGGRPKPDVVAPSTSVMVWDSINASNSASGTSFATPMVSSIAALLNSKFRQQGGTTTVPNEIVRSIIAASAQQNVDKVTIQRRTGGFPIVPKSDFDGAGGVDAAGAVDIFAKSRYGYIQLPGTCPSPTGPNRFQILPGAKFTLQYGERARVAMAYSAFGTRLGSVTADFDIVVAEVDPAGKILRLVAWSGFQDNTLEAIEFKADFAGTFQVFYKNSTIGPCLPPRYIGYAFWPNVPGRP
ncbi:MAG: S8 family serine peptidase [Myxococcaceae bacterium]